MSESASDKPTFAPPGQSWNRPAEEILEELQVDRKQGLNQADAKRRLQHFGPNRLQRARRRSALAILLEQFKNIIVLLLAAAATVSFAFGEIIEGVAILAVIILNSLLGFFTELRAVRSMESLRELGRVESQVRREGTIRRLEADEIVPGDILVIEAGDVVTADARLIEASKLQADESALTGESVPVGKTSEPVQTDEPLAERSSMIYKGTSITRGAGEAVVVSTGKETELGEVKSLVEQAEEETTPLEKRLDKLGGRLVWGTLGIAAFIAVGGILLGRDVFLIIETSLALAVAAVPEGLPIVATIALARGMQRMAKRNALLRQLSAVETLGSTTVILTDKTGTLTQNEMSLEQIVLSQGTVKLRYHSEGEGNFELDDQPVNPQENETLAWALKVGALCTNAELPSGADQHEGVGDPLEIALLGGARLAGFQKPQLLRDLPEERERAFDPETKMMATIHRRDGGFFAAAKGAPDAVFQHCERQLTNEGSKPFDEAARHWWTEQVQRQAVQGYRVLALASREMEEPDEDPYRHLTLVGIASLLDPARQDVRQAIQNCQTAGVRVVMVTGDQEQTAEEIAKRIELVEGDEPSTKHGQDMPEEPTRSEDWLDVDIFARVTPSQKLSLVETYQQTGDIVAMTGDGVNDAPALKQADIGIAMGRRGTQVAKEAADMVLEDDAFSTILVAIEHGRSIFNNIRKFVIYLLSCNVSEILVVSLASFAGLPLPIRPLQILFLNLVTDVFPALALGLGEAGPHVMRRPPRDPQEPILTRRHWHGVGGYAALISTGVLGAYGLALFRYEMEVEVAITIAFLTLAAGQLWHVFNMRTLESSFLRNEVTRNPYVWGALTLCIGLLLAAIYLPLLSQVLGTVPLDSLGWSLVAVMSLFPLIVGQALKAVGWGHT